MCAAPRWRARPTAPARRGTPASRPGRPSRGGLARRRHAGRRAAPCNRPDGVRVALLAEEELALHGELLLDGVARDQRVEGGLVALLLRPQDAAQPLRLLLPRAEGARDLDGKTRLGEVHRE